MNEYSLAKVQLVSSSLVVLVNSPPGSRDGTRAVFAFASTARWRATTIRRPSAAACGLPGASARRSAHAHGHGRVGCIHHSLDIFIVKVSNFN